MAMSLVGLAGTVLCSTPMIISIIITPSRLVTISARSSMASIIRIRLLSRWLTTMLWRLNNIMSISKHKLPFRVLQQQPLPPLVYISVSGLTVHGVAAPVRSVILPSGEIVALP